MPKKTRYTIYFFSAAIVLSAAFNAYLIRSDVGGYALWNTKEAYFFIGQNIRGRHVKWIGYPFLILGEILGNIQPPDDDRGRMFVIRVTSDGVERHDLEFADPRPGSGPSEYTPRDGRIWVNYPTLGGLCWWAGDHFERATQEEQARLGGIGALNNDFYDNRNGWSKHGLGGNDREIKLNDGTELMVSGGVLSERDPTFIEMRKEGGEPQTILNVGLRVGLASRSEYRSTFQEHR